MEDKVGSVIPSEREVAKLVEDVHAIERRIERFTISLSRDQRIAVLKFRNGGEPIVQTVGELAERHELALPGISVDAMRADLLLAQRLAPLATAIEALAQRVDDTILEAKSESWWAATAIYTALSRLASASPAIETALQPVVAFFALGRRGAKSAAASEPQSK